MLDNLVTQLLERETIDRNGLTDIFAAVVDAARAAGLDRLGHPDPVPDPARSTCPRTCPAAAEPTPEITIGPGSEGGPTASLPPMAPPTGPPASGPMPPHTVRTADRSADSSG